MRDAPPQRPSPDAPESAAPRGPMSLNARGLVYEKAGRRLVDGITLSIDGPGLVAIMGPNGAGKSLLLRLLHGLIAPSRGTIHWGGLPMSGEITRHQALVFQRPVLLRRSAAANIDFVLKSRRLDRSRAAPLLARVGLEHRASAPARALSSGEQQRLALARALATEPDVLFLDEPTAHLDPAATLLIETIAREVAGTGTRVMFVTHDAAQARRVADEVVFLSEGRIGARASAASFFSDPPSEAARAYIDGRLLAGKERP